MKRFILIQLLLIGVLLPVASQERLKVADYYEKAEYRIEMRDGVKLHTTVYSPKDKSEEYPIIMKRTPYSVRPYGEDMTWAVSPNNWLQESGYIFVFQDVRGKFMSEGEFVNMRPVLGEYKSDQDVDETTDTWDTAEWLINNIENNNGKIGVYGNSYLGFYSVMAVIHAHPAVVCAIPQAPISDWFLHDDMHHNGAFALPLVYNFFQRFGQERKELTESWPSPLVEPLGDMYHYFLKLGPIKNINEQQFKGRIEFWNKMAEHPNYDAFWQSRSTMQYLRDIKPAVLTVGGWYDGEDLSGALHTYKTIEAHNPGTVNHLVMAPNTHGGWQFPERDKPSIIPFEQDDLYFYQHEIEFPFFEHYLKGEGNLELPEAWIFETGVDEWRAYDAWPPVEVEEVQYYLSEGGVLTTSIPGGKGVSGKGNAWAGTSAPYDVFISDPDKPVPYTAHFHAASSFYHRQYLSEDQRFASTRPDVLVYEGEVLKEDLSVAGPVEVELYVSTTGTDADWVAKLIDVYPEDSDKLDFDPRDLEVGGYQMLIRGDIFRGKYRKSFEHPEPFVPGEVTKVKFILPDVSHTFRKGHRLMVQVQSSWFPLFDRNPQTFTNIYTCDESAFQKAEHRVYRSADYASSIRLMVKEK